MKFLLFIFVLFFSPLARAEENVAEKINQCIGCHHIPGYRSVFPEVYPVPKIIGQSATYIEAALKDYRSGERDHPSMSSIAAQLSDEDIKQLADFYEKYENE